MVKFGLIEPATASYAAATVLPVKKDTDGNYTDRRMCRDYRMLNLKTEQDRYPVPIPEDIFDRIEGCRYFTIMDMHQGFNQIEMRHEDKENTAFWASNRRWQWTVMPFGLNYAGACFQRVMDDALAHHPNPKCYIDDVLIYSTTFEQHVAYMLSIA